MPGTELEKVRFAQMLLDSEVMPDTMPVWADGTRATDQELDEVGRIAVYEAEYRAEVARRARQQPYRRRAMELLKRFLDDAQREQLRRAGHFDHVAPSGRRYRFWPYGGA